MIAFTLDQWVILLLVFLLGLFIGGFLFASGRWKRRYREEAARCETLERENAALRRDQREMDNLRDAAVRHPVDRGRGPL